MSSWLFDPTVGELVGAAVGLLLLYVFTKDSLWSQLLKEIDATVGRVRIACATLEVDTPGLRVGKGGEVTNA